MMASLMNLDRLVTLYFSQNAFRAFISLRFSMMVCRLFLISFSFIFLRLRNMYLSFRVNYKGSKIEKNRKVEVKLWNSYSNSFGTPQIITIGLSLDLLRYLCFSLGRTSAKSPVRMECSSPCSFTSAPSPSII